MPGTAADFISLAFEHTKLQLFRPFRFGQWARLAVVGLFAGEMGSAGGCHMNIPTSAPHHHDYLAGSSLFPSLDPVLLIPLMVVTAFALPILWLLFLYISSHMRFVLFDSVIAKKCSIRSLWHGRRGPALQYFVWQIVFSLVTLGAIAAILGIPALIALTLGWFTQPREHVPGLILAGALVFLSFSSLWGWHFAFTSSPKTLWCPKWRWKAYRLSRDGEGYCRCLQQKKANTRVMLG